MTKEFIVVMENGCQVPIPALSPMDALMVFMGSCCLGGIHTLPLGVIDPESCRKFKLTTMIVELEEVKEEKKEKQIDVQITEDFLCKN